MLSFVIDLPRLRDFFLSSSQVLLFIDEADAFLSSRARKDMTEDMRNALTALLYQTGEQSHRFVMVLATNRPNDLDTASSNNKTKNSHTWTSEQDTAVGLHG